MNIGHLADFLLGVVAPSAPQAGAALHAQLPDAAEVFDFAALLEHRVRQAAIDEDVLRPEESPDDALEGATVPPGAPPLVVDAPPPDVTTAQPIPETGVEAVPRTTMPEVATPAEPDVETAQAARTAPSPAPANGISAPLPAIDPRIVPLEELVSPAAADGAPPVIEPVAPVPVEPSVLPAGPAARPIDAFPDKSAKAFPDMHVFATPARTGRSDPKMMAAADASSLLEENTDVLLPRPQADASPIRTSSSPGAEFHEAPVGAIELTELPDPTEPVVRVPQPLIRSTRMERMLGLSQATRTTPVADATPDIQQSDPTPRTVAPTVIDAPRSPGAKARRAPVDITQRVSIDEKPTPTSGNSTPALSPAADSSPLDAVAPAGARTTLPADASIDSATAPVVRHDLGDPMSRVAAAPPPEVAERVALGRESIAPTVNREVVDFVEAHGRDGGAHKARIRIHPPELGTVSIELRVQNHKVAMELVVENRDVKALLDANESRIRASLSDQGLSLESFNVGMSHQSRGDQQASQRQVYDASRVTQGVDTESAMSPRGLMEILTDRRVNVFA